MKRTGPRLRAREPRSAANFAAWWESGAAAIIPTMSEIRVSQPHNVTAEEARKKVQEFESMVQKYGVSSSWSGNEATLKGTGVSGSIKIAPRSVDVVVKLGMMAKAFGVDPAKLKSSIEKRLKAAFEGEDA